MKMKLGTVIRIGFLIAGVPWVARADLFDKTNVTASTLSTSINAFYYSGVAGDYEDIAAYFYQAQANADADTTASSASSSGPGPARTTTYWSSWDGRFHAFRHTWDMQLTIDLRSYTNPVYKSAWLEWPVDVAYESEDYPTVYTPYRQMDFSRQLVLGVTQGVHEVFSPSEWNTWGEYDGQGIGGKIWRVQGNGYPKVWVSKQNYEVRPGPVSPDPSKANQGDPINAINGNVSVEAADLLIPCPGMPLSFSRSYNSALDYDGPLGPRWTHSFNWFIAGSNTVFEGNTNQWQVVQTGSGENWFYKVLSNDVFDAAFDTNARLSVTNSKHHLTFPAGIEYVFNTNGALESIADKWNNVITLTYTNVSSTNLLSRVDHNNGQFLEYAYQGTSLTNVATPSADYSTAFAYNNLGELTGVITRTSGDLYPTAYLYDYSTNFCNHSLTQRVNAAGDVYSWEYAVSDGKITSQGIRTVVASNKFERTFTYSTNDLNCTTVTVVRDGTDITFENWYDPVRKRITELRGPNPASTNWGNNGQTTQYSYDDFGNEIGIIIYDNAEGASLVVSNQFDAYHNLTNTAMGYGQAPSNWYAFTWDTNLNLMTGATDPEGCRTEWSYTDGRLVSTRVFPVTNEPAETTLAYTTNGLLAAVTNANGHWVRFENDSFGNPTSAIPQVGPSIFYSFTSLGHLQKIEMPPLTFTPEGRDPGSTNGTWSYRVTLFDTDERGQVSKITYPDASFETFKYDLLGNLTNHVDTGGRTTRFTYGPASHLASMTRTLTSGGSSQAVTTSIEYDSQFNTVSIRDPLDRDVETYVLDLQDRPITITNVEGQVMSVNYGLGNFIRSVIRYDGTSVSNTYDIAGNLTQVHYPDTTNTFSYLKNNLLRTAANSLGTVSNAYDAANRLTTAETVAPNGTVSYTYFPAGQVSNVTSVAGTVTYALDGADRAEAIASLAGTFDYTFNTNNGLAAGMQCTNNGLNVAYSYDSLDRLTGITWRNASNEVLRSFSYEFDAAGMITGVTREDGQSIAYGYDSLDRLTAETQRDSVNNVVFDESISYDLAGNRSSKTRDGVTVSYTRGAGNRLTNWEVMTTNLSAVVDVVGTANEPIGTAERYGQLWVSNAVSVKPMVEGTNFYALGFPVGLGTQQIVAAICDLAGNTTLVTNSVYMTIVTNADYGFNAAGCVTSMVYAGVQYSRAVSLSWNGQYQLTSVATNGTTAESYGWDALGRMAYVAQGTTTNWLVYDGDLVVADINSTGGVVRSYVWGPGIDNLLSMTVHTGATAKTYYALTDQQRSVHAMVDETGAIVESYRFDAWGRVLGVYDGQGVPLAQSAIGNRFLWQGKPYSFQSGLYCNRARFYDPVAGRFISKDPSGITGGLNGYTYCENDPVNRFDPDGLDWLDNAANFSAGFADTVSFGLTSVARKAGGYDYVDRGSGAYRGGVGAGIAHGLAMGGGGLLKGGAALRAGTTRPVARLFADGRAWKSISRAFWRGGADGRHLHHWLIPQRWVQGSPLLRTVANGQWNTVVIGGRFNSTMGTAGHFGLGFFISGSLAAPITGGILLNADNSLGEDYDSSACE